MKKPSALTLSMLSACLICMPALAQTVDFCTIQNQEACGSAPPVLQNSTSPMLTIRGNFKNAAGSRGVSGFIYIENVDSGQKAKLTVHPVLDALDTARGLVGQSKPSVGNGEWGGALEAAVYVSSLPAGQYRVTKVEIKAADFSTTTMDVPVNGRGQFSIQESAPGEGYGIQIKNPGGDVVAHAKPVFGSSWWKVTGYPALRNGNYSIEATVGDKSASNTFILQRPSTNISASLPFVDGLPEVTTRAVIQDVLQSRGVNGSYAFVNDSVHTITADGASIPPGSSIPVTLTNGIGFIRFGDEDTSAGTKTVSLFDTAPDGQNVQLTLSKWNLESLVQMQPSKSEVAIKVDNVAVTPLLSGSTSSNCRNLRSYSAGERLFETMDIQCAVLWKDRGGVDFDKFKPGSLLGAVPNIGANNLSYRLGVVYTNPSTKVTSFYPSSAGDQSLSIRGIDPNPIELEFKSYASYAGYYAAMGLPDTKKIVRLTPASATSGQLVGNINIKGAHNGLRTRIVSGADQRDYATSFNAAGYPVTSKISEALQESNVQIEAWYDKAPEYKKTINFSVIGLPLGPMVFIDRDIPSHTEANTIVTGIVGVSVGNRIEYDPVTDGNWIVDIVDAQNPTTVYGSGNIGGDGKFSVNLGRLAVGQRRMKGIGRLVGGSGSDFTTKSPQDFYLATHDGRAPSVTVTTKTDAAAVPFGATMSVTYQEVAQATVSESPTWELSSDSGSTWAAMVDDKSRPYIGPTASKRFTESGQYKVRATVKNKYSGLSTTTDGVALLAYDSGTIKLNATSAIAVNLPASVEAQLDGFGANPDIRWQLISGAGSAVNTQASGLTYTFTPTSAIPFTVRVLVKSASAPDVARSWVSKDIGIRAVQPLLASTTIDGPTAVEVGKTYRYVARVNDVVNSSTSKSYTIKGAWLLPNGSRQEGDTIDYTIASGQTAIVYTTWVDGLPGETRNSAYPIRPWTYTWPTWTVDMQVSENTVPARVTYAVRSTDVKLAELRGEPITVTWSLPENVSATGDGMTGAWSISQTGRYQMQAQISDSRGNVTNITTPEAQIQPAPQVVGSINLVSPYGVGKYFAPGKYVLSYKIESLPRGDRFSKNEVLINGDKVGEFFGTSAVVDITTPGEYTIGVRTLTQLGNFGITESTVPMADAPKPTCSMSRIQTATGTTLTPTCTAEAGAIAAYEWNYLLRGEARKLASRSNFVRVADYGAVSNMTLKVTTTLGASDTFNITPPTAVGP